jgi:hypothetical protein
MMISINSKKTHGHWGLSLPGALLRLEGLAVLTVAVALYAYQGYSWLILAWLFLVPDLALAVYAINKQAGSIVYNVVHTYALALVLAFISLLFGFPPGLQLALICFAHIGLDRMVGYGLKYADSFKNTHLSRV